MIKTATFRENKLIGDGNDNNKIWESSMCISSDKMERQNPSGESLPNTFLQRIIMSFPTLYA